VDGVAPWAAGFRTPDPSDAFPPHHPGCLGCGPDNPYGYHLQAWRDGERVRARQVFDERHVGAPGIAHGGAVATVVDDLLGFVLYLVGEPAVTRHLEVDYLAPVLLGVPYLLQAWLARRDGRKLFLQLTGTDEQARRAVDARAVFVVVGLEHFTRAADRPVGGRPPIAP